MTYVIIYGDELYHHGIKGQKWGVRRFQNADGSLKPAGRKRYTDYKPAIKEYRDSYDKASSMNDAADAKWRDVQDARKNLGRTAIGRTIASARNKTEAAKKYNRMYDEWSKMQDDADEQWRDAHEKYKNTGGNRLTRIANNIRYDTKYGSAKSGEKKQLTYEEREAKNARAEQKREDRRARAKKAVKIGATVAASALLAYGTYKLLDKAEVANTGRKLSKKALAENNGDFEAAYKAILGREQKTVHEYAVGNLDKSAMDRAKRVYGSSSKQLASQWMHSKRQNNESMRELSELAGKRTIGRIYR